VPTSLPAPVVTPPPAKLAGLRVTAGSTAGRLSHGRCVAAAPKLRHDKSCRRPGLLRIRYTLTRASAVTVTIARTAPGRSVKGRCVAVTRANRGRHACVRVTRTLGSITETAAAGARTLTLPARIGGHTLGPGTYRLTVTPSGGTPHTKTFRISG
jgi:hypothetical protein